jgi:hypothetical protein
MIYGSTFGKSSLTLTALGLIFFLVACAASREMPDWVNGPKASAYPDHQFLLGVGQGETRAVAEQRAYAALARIFKADVTSEMKDWESYLNLERRGSNRIDRRLFVETITKVSTDKVLENVRIADTWKNPGRDMYAALAVLERGSTAAALSHRIAELDDAIARDIEDSGNTPDKMVKLRGLHRAARNLMARDSLNSDLRIVSAQSLPRRFSLLELSANLQKFVNDNLIVLVDVTGDQADAVRQAVIGTLLREGLPVVGRLTSEATVPDLIVRGNTRLWPAEFPDPRFRYVRWCADFTFVTPHNQRILGNVARSGREGHLNYREASNRALSALKQEASAALVKALHEQLYGEAPAEPVAAICPRLTAP